MCERQRSIPLTLEVMAQEPTGAQVPQHTPVNFIYNAWGTGQSVEEPPADFGGVFQGRSYLQRIGEELPVLILLLKTGP